MRATLLIFTLAGMCAGQSFEVATIKPSADMGRGMSIGRAPGGRFQATNASLKDLVMFAYDVRSFQIAGGPSWTESAPFNVIAKPEGGEPNIQQLRGMVRKLLEDRFELKEHHETRETSVYALVVAKGGPKLKDSVSKEMGISGGGRGRMAYRKVAMGLLAQNLSQMIGRAVVDRTELHGEYDFTLEWTDEQNSDGTGPSLFTALQEQAGLKLESAKGPVDILVIDHAARPSEN